MKTKRDQRKTECLPTVALLGRVNVGKSTLFNRLIEEDKALVSPMPGTTRTRNEGIVHWRGGSFRLVDTGGLSFDDGVELEKEIIAQSEAAIEEADLILFVVDGKGGILPEEYALAKQLWKRHLPLLLAINKIDSAVVEQEIPWQEIARLNLAQTALPISATNGRNLGDLLDTMIAELKQMDRPMKEYAPKEGAERARVAIIGKPNVGKSSLFNKIIGEERVIVSALPHTTREPHDTTILSADEEGNPFPITFIDTAGIRRKAKVGGSLERAGIQKSIETIRRSDIVLLVLDGTEPFSHQDKQLASLLERQGKSILIMLTKWDMLPDHSDKARALMSAAIQRIFPHLSFAPMIFVSGKTGYRVHQIMPFIPRLVRARNIEIPADALRHFLEQAVQNHKPSRGKGTRHPAILGMSQVHVGPPVFQITVKYRTSLHRSYLQYLEHQLREQFDFFGCPIRILIKKQKR